MTQIDQKWSELKGSVRGIVNPDIDPDTKTSDLSRLTVAPWPMETLNKSNRDYTREPRTSTLLRNFREPPTRNFPNANTFIFSYLGAVSGGQTNLFQNKEKFLLFGQIEHKRRLIEKMIDPDLEIIMVRVSTRPRKTFKIFIDYKKPIDQNNGRDKHMMILSFE